jgi:predicted ester cyclase
MMPKLAELRDLAERYTAAWCSQNPVSVAAFYAPNASLTINSEPPAEGRNNIAVAALKFMKAFPDLHLVLNDIVINGERAVYHWTLSGTNTGPGGTGHRVRISGFEVWTIGDDALIAESRGHFDDTDYQRQLQRGSAEIE